MYIEKETQPAKFSFFAIKDINARVAHAIKEHPKLESCPQHQAKIQQVINLLKYHAQYSDYNNIYSTARAATAKMPAHTEVKINRMSSRMYKKDQLKCTINQLKYKLVYKPSTQSYSVHIPL